MRQKVKSVFLRTRKYVFLTGSFLPRMVNVSLNATGDCRWIRIGLVPGFGKFRNTKRFFSLATGIWVRAPESRTATVSIGSANRGGRPAVQVAKNTGPDDSKVVRWGLLSTAKINKSIIPPLRKSQANRLVAAASRDREKVRHYGEAWQIPRTFGSYEEMLASDAIDAVYVSLPNHLHAEWTIKALEAGKHVLCEKPLALSVAEVDAIADAVEKTGLVVAEAFMYRHHERTIAVKKLLDSGAIGEVRSIRGAFTFSLANPENIRLSPDMGGGSLWDVGCYPVSFARYLMDAEPHRVTGFKREGPSGVDVHFWGQLAFRNGVVAQIESGFDAPLEMSLSVVGSEGVLEVPNAYKPGKSSVILVHRGQENTERIVINGGDLYRGELEDMAEAILQKRSPLLSLGESRENVRVLRSLYAAAESERILEHECPRSPSGGRLPDRTEG